MELAIVIFVAFYLIVAILDNAVDQSKPSHLQVVRVIKAIIAALLFVLLLLAHFGK